MTPAYHTLARIERELDLAMRRGDDARVTVLRCERADLRLMLLEPAGTARLMGAIGGVS